ncbi:MAG: ABC transporter substrate-binding protein [Streptosporangiales bacterium]|nr:ABC transporter substrate-binding protein [Streptosporangiales bacterium]
MRTLRYVLVVLLVGVGLAACGSGDGGTGGKESTAGQQARTVRHAMGTTEIIGRPGRVVVLDTGELDSAIALGVKPVGAVEAVPGAGFPDYLAEQTRGVQIVGSIEQPNLEKIAALQPDLILSSKLRHEAIYDQLSQIAPTVFTEEVGVTWKANFRLHAEALGRSEQAQRLMKEYEQKVAAFREAMGERLDGTTVSVVRSVGSEVRIYMRASFIGTILEDAGLSRPKPQDKDVFSETATRERIRDLDGQVMVLAKYGDDHQLLEQLMGSPLWSRLRVVRDDRVYEVSDDLWFLGIGNLAARKVVEDLHTIFVENQRLPGDAAGR